MFQPKFSLGKVVVTYGADNDLSQDEISNLIRKHSQLDQGELCDEDYQMNITAIQPGQEDRIFSCFVLHGERYYVITEWDRSVTTVLRADEY